ncbi:MAG: histidine phosphatase family protein, partial [Fimbriimonadaceae bacterium]|nr:histidine phosphatase family protein [Chitinophagales bacterium]
MKEIYIIRHGETDFNHKGIVQGRGVNSSLNNKGREQSKNFYEAYKTSGFEKIYVSTLKRTHETVDLFQHHDIEIEKHQGLDEISWGIHEGKSNGETFKQFYEILHAWKSGDIDVKIEAGESPLDVQQRQKEFIKDIIERKENKIL